MFDNLKKELMKNLNLELVLSDLTIREKRRREEWMDGWIHTDRQTDR